MASSSMYASVAPQFTRELLSPGLRVGYTDEGGVWPFLAPSLLQRLPLRAIEWRNLVGVTKRIDQLPLHFVEISGPTVRKDLPLACIYVVKCEDFDTYKSTVRPPLLAWVDVMTGAKVEWLVLYVPLGTRPKAAGNVPNSVYKKVFDRLRADFAHSKGGPLLRGALGPAMTASASQDRVCKIDTLEGTSFLGQQQQHESQWTELLLRLRHCVMDAFQTKCFHYEESLRVLDAKRRASGWDFGAFFVAKEKLALMYQQMYLQDDAIRHFDELDAIFVNLNEHEKQSFRDDRNHSFSRHDAIFTQSPLALNLTKTQEIIAENRASLQLVALYCFCRQIRTLYVMGAFPQLLERATCFIESFLSELKAMAKTNTLEWYQPFLWAVGACMEISYACELAWSGRDDEWTASSVSVQAAQAIPVDEMSRGLGNVLYLARRILTNFATLSRSKQERILYESPISATWYQQLQHVLAGKVCESYARCLAEVSHLASMHFSQSGRHRFAVFLGKECATYHLARGEFESASRLLRSLARQSEEDGWWTIVGACVRTICHAELALGRSTQAVAACFSMLQLAQEEHIEMSTQEVKELMGALVSTLDGKTATENTKETLVNMGELFRPTIAVETMQSSGSALEDGEIRVTLGLANDFPTGVHLDKVRIRFIKKLEEGELVTPADQSFNGSLAAERYDFKSQRQSQSVEVEVAKVLAIIVQNVHNETHLLLEENNVHLDEKTGVNLVFLHSGIPVGHYSCTGVECVLAGSTFRLLPISVLKQASFDIVAKEDTVQVAIEGAPLLIPRPFAPVETVIVSIQANNEKLVNGMLEMCVFKRAGIREKCGYFTHCEDDDMDGEDEDECTIQLIQADVRNTSDSAQFQSILTDSPVDEELTCVLTVALPTIPRKGCLSYVVALAVSPLAQIDRTSEPDDEEAILSNVTMRASVRYHREALNSSGSATSTEVRCTESSFRVVQPLTQVVRLKRVGSRVFTSIALTCNPFIAVALQDYKFNCSNKVTHCNVHSSVLTVEHDPNVTLRKTLLRPSDCVHLTFTLRCGPEFEELVQSTQCSLTVDLSYGEDRKWLKTMTIQVPLTEVEGNWYRIDVVPRKVDVNVDESVEATASEPLTFQIVVQEVSRYCKPAVEDDTSTFILCLSESSEQDWILVGKQRERLTFESWLETTNGDQRREFRTQASLFATHIGRVRFPAFHLEVNGQAISPARVHCQQNSRRVLVHL